MAARDDWKVPAARRPRPERYAYDLDAALSSVLALSTRVPAGAFTAETLGTERAGHGVAIADSGLVLTIGYLVTEAESIWLTTVDGRVVAGHLLGYDQVTGFGLVQALGRLDVPSLPFGESASVEVGAPVVVAGSGGRHRAVAAEIVARQEFAGYWEYVLDDALFTAPSHPFWGGTALIGAAGDLLGIGSLQLQTSGRRAQDINMIVPIDLVKPILEDMTTYGRPRREPRPWLGLYATEMEERIVVMGLAEGAPAQAADIGIGDVVLAVAGRSVNDLADLFRRVWSLGTAGVPVPLTVEREGRTLDVTVASGDRDRYLVAPRLH